MLTKKIGTKQKQMKENKSQLQKMIKKWNKF